MKRVKKILLIFLFETTIVLSSIPLDTLDKILLNKVFFPLNSDSDRTHFEEIKPKLLDGFGAYRRAGHKHTGLDIKGGFNEPVYAIGKGMVKAVHNEFPYSTVLIQHILPDDEIVYSAYIHIENIEVVVNQLVNQNTQLGRLFSEEEYKTTGFYHNHLHFEIRKTFERYTRISIQCFSTEELNQYFYDPLIFLSQKMGKKT